MLKRLKIFAGSANSELGQAICEYLDVPLGQVQIGKFPDSETRIKIEEDIRGSDLFIIQSTSPPVNDNLMELLIFIDCARRASAGRVTAVIPYYGYGRQDRKDEGRVPISAKLVANLIEKAGADRVLSVDLHATQIQGFFDIPLDHLYAFPVFLDYYKRLDVNHMVVCSTDVGRVKMARAYANALNAGLVIIDKRRKGASSTEVTTIIGEARNKHALIVDDMITTGGSICEAARVLQSAGAKSITMGATHAVLCGPAVERIDAIGAREVVVTDTVPLEGKQGKTPIRQLTIAPLLAEAIKRIHEHRSVSSLFNSR